MHISIIVAAAENGAIGKNNELLWRLPDDLKRFKQLTLGHPMIMGRKTFDSIGKALPGRTSIVVTRSPDFFAENVLVAHSLQDAFQIAREVEIVSGVENQEAFVIGGGEIYRQALPLTDRIYLTKVKATIEGDTFFEMPENSEWAETARVAHEADERHKFSFEFIDYSKKTRL